MLVVTAGGLILAHHYQLGEADSVTSKALIAQSRHPDRNWNVQSELERLWSSTESVSLSGVGLLLVSAERTPLTVLALADVLQV